jgi:16S rRNA (adenine1518-N6/adenine1519-N6)-dimethyltransferase
VSPSSGHRPRKRFGQHFLVDPAILDRLVAVIAPAQGQHMVEIGPGQGVLTLPLLRALDRLDVIELDRDLAGRLLAACGGSEKLRVHQADALKFDFCALAQEMGAQRLRVVGNLPYNISTPLLFHLVTQLDCIEDMHFMLQKEVVDRITAQPGESAYGRLGIMLQYHCRTESLFPVPPTAFRPPPKVDSAVVRLRPHVAPPVSVRDPTLFSQVVAQAFSQRRKTLRNSLKTLLTADQINAAGIDPAQRPERLTLAEFAALADAVAAAVPEDH